MKYITYEGRTYTFDPEVLVISGSLESHRFEVASAYGRTLELAARLKFFRDTVDDRYRHWRAKMQVEIEKRDGKKPAEASIKAEIEANEQFLDYRKDIGRANNDVEFVEGWLRALDMKSRMLAVRTYDETAGERVAGGMRVSSGPIEAPREPGAEMRRLGRAARERRENNKEEEQS